MDSQTWNNCAHLHEMLGFVGNGLTDRQRRLLAVACCQRLGPLLSDRRSRMALEIAERFAQSAATEQELLDAQALAYDAYHEILHLPIVVEDVGNRWTLEEEQAARAVVLTVAQGNYYAQDAAELSRSALAGKINRWETEREEESRQCDYLRDLVGPYPFLTFSFDPLWCLVNDKAVHHLAKYIDEEKAYDQFFILGDALEDAGCIDPVILDHCRGSYRHIQGCWLLDLLLQQD